MPKLKGLTSIRNHRQHGPAKLACHLGPPSMLPSGDEVFEVFGNYGRIMVRASDGVVLGIDCSESDASQIENYHDISRFNVIEWRSTYPDEPLAGTSVDILDIGFWFGPNDSYATATYRPAGLHRI